MGHLVIGSKNWNIFVAFLFRQQPVIQARILCLLLPIHYPTRRFFSFPSSPHDTWGHLYSANFSRLLQGYQCTDSFVWTKVNYLVNGIYPVPSIKNSCLAVDLCHSSLMSADQKAIKNTLVRPAIRSWSRWRRRTKKARDKKRETQREATRFSYNNEDCRFACIWRLTANEH